MSYRPITDLWLLTRAKLKGGRKYYGAYLGGFPERARALIGVPITEPLLHVCGGMARYYPYRGGFGEDDKTLDLAPETSPDFLQNCMEPLPLAYGYKRDNFPDGVFPEEALWLGNLADPPYTPEDAGHYAGGITSYPNPHAIVRNMLEVTRIGGKVGIIHYVIPRCPPNAKFVACIGVGCGFGNRLRCFTVFERLNKEIYDY